MSRFYTGFAILQKGLNVMGKVWINPDMKSISVIQMDEFWHFTKKTGINFGLGGLYVPKERKVLPFFVENETKSPQKPSGHI